MWFTKNKTMLKCLFIFVDQNETKQNVITLFVSFVALYYFCSISVSLQGLSGLPGFFFFLFFFGLSVTQITHDSAYV